MNFSDVFSFFRSLKIKIHTELIRFGMKLKSVDDSAARKMPGIKDIFTIKSLKDDYERQNFDTCTFTELVVVVGNTTWEVLSAKKVLKVAPASSAACRSSLFVGSIANPSWSSVG